MSRKPKPEEPKVGAPGWIVTFSDMITLLLTFFVLLVSMADKQVEDHKFMRGQVALRQAFTAFGLPGFPIRRGGSQMDHQKSKYAVPDGQDEKEDRSLDAETEMLRRVLMDIETMMTISPSQIAGLNKKFIPTNIKFPAGTSLLTSDAKEKLLTLCEQVTINYSGQDPIIYVLGLAAGEKDTQAQWALSAERAQAVADDIRAQLPAHLKWPIFCWGAGSGGEWTGRSGQVTERTEILIAVLTETGMVD